MVGSTHAPWIPGPWRGQGKQLDAFSKPRLVAKPPSLRRAAPIPVQFPPRPSRPGRLVAATACQGRHETPGTWNHPPAGPDPRPPPPPPPPATSANAAPALELTYRP